MALAPSLNPQAASPLYVQLQQRLRGLIQGGAWKPGMRLPAVQDLASQFQVHRLTALKAIGGLKRTGWVQTVNGRGTFVAERLPQPPVEVEGFPLEGSASRIHDGELGPWLGETLERAQDRHLLSFSAGFPPADLLPGEALRRTYTRTMKELGSAAWAYSAPAGHPAYLKAVSQWLASEGEPLLPGWGLRAIPGAQSGLALAVEALTVPGDRVLVESPCYVGTLALLKAMGR
ncbi:MAG: GntR family transcriptional regulator, partial [Firmicutes bacterium]|nr:GntR family transcriptional regulator [Bacillota bacterium]